MRKQKLVLIFAMFLFAGNLFALDNWTDVSNPEVTSSLNKLQVFNDNFYFIKTSSDFYLVSTNQGVTWTKFTLNFTPAVNEKYEFASENNIYWLRYIGNHYGVLLRSTNNGVSFDTVKKAGEAQTFPGEYGLDNIYFLNSQVGFIYQYAYPTGGSFNTYEYLHKTTNGGISWDTSGKFTYFASSIHGSSGSRNYFNSYKFFSDNIIGFATYVSLWWSGPSPGWSSKIVKTTNSGTNWSDASQFVNGNTYGTIIYCDSTWAYFTTANASNNNVMRFRGVGTPIDTICPLTGDYYFKNRKEGFCYTGSSLSYSNDSGKTWAGGTLGHAITNVTFVNNNLGFALTNDGKIYRTTNGGAITPPPANFYKIETGDKYFYKYLNSIIKKVIVSDSVINGKKYFKEVTNGSSSIFMRIDSISGNLLRFDNGSGCGVYYQESLIDSLNASLRDSSRNCSFLPVAISTPAACTDTTTVSIFGMNKFRKEFIINFSSGYDRNRYAKDIGLVYHVSWRVGAGGIDEILIGVKKGGVFYGDSTLVGIYQISSEVPDKYSLSQNYPNPFNPSTKINYEIKSSGFVSLKVFDLLGKEVAALVNEQQNSGSYAVDFNSGEFNLPSGIYFYTLNAGEFKETRKMVLVK